MLVVAVVPGRTRTLVERFERKERSYSNEDQATEISTHVLPATDKAPPTLVNICCKYVDYKIHI